MLNMRTVIFRDRVEFYDDNGIIAGEITVLNKGVD